MLSVTRQGFLWEAVKITLFCLLITALSTCIAADKSMTLILFNIAVMSCVATFSLEKKRLSYVFEGGVVVALSVLTGGVLGFYVPVIAQLLTIIYVILAFLIPKTKRQTNIFVVGAMMFLIFSALPFNLDNAVWYGLYSLVLIVMLVGFYGLSERKRHCGTVHEEPEQPRQQAIVALIATIALSCAWGISVLLQHYTTLQHLYWIGLTVLAVIQGAQQGIIKTALIRIVINIAGALLIVLLMSYVVPASFWMNFVILLVFLFLIFALGDSYIARTLFIELFVLGFTHILGQYHNAIAFDRVILTLIGGVLVITATLVSYAVLKPHLHGK